MRAVRAWLVRLAATLRPGRAERDIGDEMESHLQLHVDDCVRRGMSPEEARRDARLRLGGVAQAMEGMRERRRLPALESLVADVRFGLRRMRRRPAFSAIAVLTIALGIGANTSIFTVADAVLWTPLPYARPHELMLASEGDGPGDRATTTSFATWADWRARSRTFRELALARDWQPTLSASAASATGAEQLVGARVSANFFRAIGVRPALGRDFAPAEDTPATRRVVILGHDLWRRRFASDPDIVGRTVALDAIPFTVVGVLPPDFDPVVTEPALGVRAEAWAPLGYDATLPWACRTCRHLHAIGRLAPGASRESARAELEAVTGALWREHPHDYPSSSVVVVPLADQLVGSARPILHVLLGAVGLAWLIACVNLALLLLAHATQREREVAVRMALGAGRPRVLRQLLCENCVLALLGGAAGLIPALLLPEAIAALGPRLFPRLAEVHVDGAALLFTLGLALATGILSGLAPALRLTATPLPSGLRDGARGSSGPAGRRLRRALVAAELALSLTLLVGAGLMVRTLWRLLDVSPGFDSSGVLTMKVSLSGPRYEADAAVTGYYREVLARLRAAPGVEAAAMTSQVPFGGNFDGNGFHPEGKSKPNPEQDPSAQRYGVSPDYLRVMRIPLLRGRALTEADVGGAPRVLLVNQTAAARVWPGEDPIGKRVKLGGIDEPWSTVVGVTGDVRHTALDEPPQLQMYVPHGQWRVDSQMILTVRTTGPPLEMAATLERIIRSVDPAQAVSSTAALDDLLGASVAARRLSLVLLAAFAGLALLLSAIGIYGVTACAVAERTHEIGIRLALGARPTQLLRAVLAEGAALAAAGIAAGLAAALALTRIMERLLYGVPAADPITFATVAALLAAVAMSACYIPARRVLRVDPSEALRGP